MWTRNVRCTVTEPTTETVYDVDANYRGGCPYSHDTRQEHLCDLTLRARPMHKPAVPFTVCDIAAVPNPVLVAIQVRLRAIVARAATTLPVPAERAATLVLLHCADGWTVRRRTIGAHQGDADRAPSADEWVGLWPIMAHPLRTSMVSERTGEGRLMRAVLEDAIASFRRYRSARNGRDQRLFKLERAWFTRDDVSQPFAFATICNALGLDRASLRRLLQVWEFEAAKPAEPPRTADERLADIGALRVRARS